MINAADLPHGSIVATAERVWIKRAPDIRRGLIHWDSTETYDLGTTRDRDIQSLLDGGRAQLLRLGETGA